MCFSKVVLATDRAILGATTAQAPSAMGKPPGNRHIQTGSVRAGLAPDIILVIINGRVLPSLERKMASLR